MSSRQREQRENSELRVARERESESRVASLASLAVKKIV